MRSVTITPPDPAPATALVPPQRRASRGIVIVAVLFAAGMSLAMQGYHFGKSNHTVYLVDALHRASPHLLRNDWYTTQTLQYHAAFGWITRALYGLRVIEPAFLVGHLALAVLLHAAAWRIVRALGGGAGAFLCADVLFHLSAGGTGLGMYQFLQDGTFLPSNIAAVAMLWAVALWLGGRRALAGACLGVAGLFHLNYALVGLLLWALLHACALKSLAGRWRERSFWVGTLAVAVPSLINIGFALGATASRGRKLPLGEFVDLYVKLRHPHHYDPASWPAWLWISFAWPIPLAAIYYFRFAPGGISGGGGTNGAGAGAGAGAGGDGGGGNAARAWREAARVFVIFALLLVVALIGAGVAFTSEPLIQASLYRFSVFPKLLSCIGAAFLLTTIFSARGVARASVVAGATMIALCLWRGPYAGFFRMPQDDAAYLAACDWIRANTDVDAVFLVPPSDLEFRLRAQRAIVINFKGIPQLSGELPVWRDRLQAVLDLPDLRVLPRPFPRTLDAIRARYDSLPPEHLASAAEKFGARYVLTSARWGAAHEPLRVDLDGNTSWFLYDLARGAKASR